MWLLVIGIVVVLIIGYNIGFSIRDWQHKKWLDKTNIICPECKSDDVNQTIYKEETIAVRRNLCGLCGFWWEWRPLSLP